MIWGAAMVGGLAKLIAASALVVLAACAPPEPAGGMDAFRQRVAAAVAKAYPGARIELPGDAAIVVTVPGETPNEQDLKRAYGFYADDPDKRGEVVAKVVASFAPVRVTPESLLVLVRSRPSLRQFAPDQFMFRPLAGDLIAVVAVDAPDSYGFLPPALLRKALGATDDGIWRQALANTRGRGGVMAQPLRPGHIVEVTTGVNLAASVLADDAFWDSPTLTSAGPVVVAPLARDNLYLALESDTLSVARLRTMMTRTAGDPNNLAEGLIVRREGRWEVLR